MGVRFIARRFRIHRAVWARLALASLWFASPAFAADDQPTIELSWSGPSTEVACLGGEGLTRAVNGYLGRHAISSPPAELALNVLVERQKDGWRALIKLNDQRTNVPLGERELFAKGPLCSGLDEPLKLAVALLVDSELVEVQGTESHPNTPPRVLEPEPPEPEPEDTEIDAPPLFEASHVRVALDSSLLFEKGVLPAGAGGLALGVELTAADWIALRARVAGFVPQTLEPVPGARVTASVFHGGLALCPRTEVRTGWTLLGCFGVEGGYLRVGRSGVSGGHDAGRRLLMASFSPRISAALSSKWSLLAHAEALFPAREDRFVLDVDGNARELFEVSQFVWSLGIGASVTF